MTKSQSCTLRSLLTEEGLSLDDIAAALGQTAATLRTYERDDLWRTDPVLAGDIQRDLSDLWMLCAQLRHHGHPEPAALLDARLVSGYIVRGWDLYREMDGHRCWYLSFPEHQYEYPLLKPRHGALCALAGGELSETVLDQFLPAWRTAYWTDFELEDGSFEERGTVQ